MLLFLILEFGVSTSKFLVRDVGVDVVIVEHLHVLLVSEPGIGGNNNLIFVYIV